MKRKIINYKLINSSLNYRLNDKKLYVSMEGLKLINSNLDISLELIINEDYLVSNSLEIELEKKDSDTYLIKYPNGEIETLDLLYYYLNSSNERIYVNKNDVTIKPDGSLEYEGHEVITYYKSDFGFALKGDYSDFIDSENLNLKNEEISNLEQEIFNIESIISEIEYKKIEYGKLDDIVYIEYDNAVRLVEELNQELSSLQVNANDTLYSYYNAYYDYKHSYYLNTKKVIGSAYGLKYASDSPIVNKYVSKYLYINPKGNLMESYNLEGFYNDDISNDNGVQTQYDALTNSLKYAKYYEQEFTKEIDEINEQVSFYYDVIESTEWYYKKQINQKTKSIKDANRTLLNKKAIYDDKYNTLLKNYYHECLIQFDKQLEYYNKLLIQKRYQLSIYKEQIPVNYLITADKGLVYGFNEYNKLCLIFDSYNHQLLIEYKNDKIKSITDEKGKRIELFYNEFNQLTNVRNDIGEYINISYLDNKVTRIDKDENSIIFEYKNGLLYKIYENDGIGYKINFIDNKLDKISKISKENEIKELQEFTYDNNLITLIDKTRYVFLNDNYIYSKYEYMFFDDSLILEIEYKNNEIYKILGYENESLDCSFNFESDKNDLKIFESNSVETFPGEKVFNVNLPNNLKTDYTLYAIASANSYENINEYRKTSYCDHEFNVSNIKYELKVKLIYQDEEIIYGASFNPNITSKQLVAIPVTLKEDENGKAIAPNNVIISIDYSNNNGECTLYNLALSECKYIYRSFNNAKQTKELYVSDIKYPIINNSIKNGYIIKSSHVDYSYDINELLKEEKEYISYEEYDLNDNFVNNINEENSNKYYYDSKSRLIKVIDSKLNNNINEYDDNGNLIKNISYNEKDSSNVYINEFEYDIDGKLVSDSNELGYKNKYQNSLNDILEETPNGFITRISDTFIKTDLLSNSRYINKSKLESLNSGDINYRYEYDEWGYENKLYINEELYMTFTHNDYLGKKYYKSLTNDNKGYMKVCDMYDKPLYIKRINNEVQEIIISYEYDSNDNLISVKDKDNNIIESYDYIDNVLSKVTNDNYEKKFSNDIYGNVTSISYDNDTYNYGYNNDKELVTLSHNDYTENINYDSLRRIKNINSNIMSLDYEYLNINSRTTNLIKTIKQKINNKVIYNRFKYDKCGNIIESNINHKKCIYHYDGLNRLIRFDSEELNHTYTYSFDDNGNIIEKGIHDYSIDDLLINSEYINYEYENNKLISYDNNQIIYDDSFRPINYNGNTLLWENNKLVQFGNSHYEYDYNGLRIKKDTSNERHIYIRDNNKLLKEEVTIYNNELINNESILDGINIESSSYEITYNYGINGIEGFTLNDINYHYIKNIFNDVIEIIDDNYNTYAKYAYDAYGKCNIVLNVDDIANINPIRYRSYYYDKETNLYYLNSRYYNPDTMRFISIDDVSYLDYEVLGGLNLWIYCNNNPVMYVDENGHLAVLSVLIGAIIGFACAYIPDVVNNFKDGFDWSDFNTFGDNWVKYVGAALGGAIGGLGVGIGTTMIFGGVGNVVSGAFSGDINSFGDVMVQFVFGALTSGIAYGISKGISTKLASSKIAKIIGPSAKNSIINANLAKNGFGNMKIGKMGMKAIAKELYKSLGYENLQDGIGYLLNFGMGFIF